MYHVMHHARAYSLSKLSMSKVLDLDQVEMETLQVEVVFRAITFTKELGTQQLEKS